jgi:hypothetical protein
MPGFSGFLEDKILDAIFKQTNITAFTTLFVSLHSADPTDAGNNEISGGSYARVQLNPDPTNSTDTNWNGKVDNGTARRMTNKLAITFPTATANWNSGNPITHYGIWDASSAGNFICYGTIDASGVTVLNGNTLSFQGGSPGSLRFDVD